MTDQDHIPVFLEEVIQCLNIKADGDYLDATIGGGGHARAIADLTKGKIIGLDCDPIACIIAQRNCASNPNIEIMNFNFADMDKVVAAPLDGIVMDLGTSLYQLHDPARGFAFTKNGPLDMRMDPNQKLTAMDVIKTISQRDLAIALKELSDERHALKLSRVIKQCAHNLHSTSDLAELVSNTIGHSERKHPATRVFQTIRMLVNNELETLYHGLIKAFNLLKSEGRLVVISFHRVEDRLVKHFMSSCTNGITVGCFAQTEKVAKQVLMLKATHAHKQRNISARSATLRCIEKL